jgi:hypothetical protein
MSSLKTIIEGLAMKKKEGPYWDFKESYYSKNDDLLHDVLCLANNPFHKGPRYIIFGVNDNYEYVGCSVFPVDQNNIIDFFRGLNFVYGVSPSVSLEEVLIDKKVIKVLIIQDKYKDRPYILTKNYTKGRRRVYCNLYSRTEDSNTPRDCSASMNHFNAIFEERLGIDLPPLARFPEILEERNKWKVSDFHKKNSYIYSDKPEYKMDLIWGYPIDDIWVGAASNPTAIYASLELKYNNDVIADYKMVAYDEMREICIQPHKHNFNNKPIFYIQKDWDSYFLLEFFQPQNIKTSGRFSIMPVINFDSKSERESFFESLSDLSESESEKSLSHLEFCKWIKTHHQTWKSHCITDNLNSLSPPHTDF